ncbi:hypothetical protein M569_14594 [Genlisea aurea]|uniref:Uncharacterized protein n=1 Tax=Genlisea aurea TaxID=192259 RepID=S8C028_9LAMI|nr:hypothetical protein M569_14594 [Genlisea aurea]
MASRNEEDGDSLTIVSLRNTHLVPYLEPYSHLLQFFSMNLEFAQWNKSHVAPL